MPGTGPVVPPGSSKQVLWRRIKDTVMQEAAEVLDIDAMDRMTEAERSSYLSREVGVLVQKAAAGMNVTLTRSEFGRMVEELISEITGYGPITPLLADPTVNEIMVNGPNQVYVERHGKLELTDITFRDDAHVMHVIERIVAPLGKRIDESSPMVDGRLPDGSRFNATIPPVSLIGPVLTIRKFSAKPFTMADLIRFGTLSTNMAIFLKACVEGRLNIIIGGGTASGKTTTLNVLSSLIPNNERIITIEDAAELNLQQEHVIRLESRPSNIEGKGRISIRDLVINSLRMRPDRIVVGEVRGGEALDMLQAMNTGHDGSLTTGHANSPRDLLSRLETMVLMAGVDLPVRAIREQIVSAIDLIVYQARFKDGTRKITNITEVVGMEGDVITLQDIFVFEQHGVSEDGKVMGTFRATGVLPRCLPELEAKGIHLPPGIFG
ncbi:MAG TPA: CpaF family protein [Firmicutes bacterium]|nr:CpaF family protein [Candidatus Fermentithermobacillaceae bacterium]